MVGNPGRRSRRRLGDQRDRQRRAVYGGIGILTICIAAFFRFFTALGDAQRYVDERKAEEERIAAEAVPALIARFESGIRAVLGLTP